MIAKRHKAATLLSTGLLLVACDSAGGEDGPGSVSVDEAQALDEAAEMLEERRLPEGALPPVDLPHNAVLEGESPEGQNPEETGE